MRGTPVSVIVPSNRGTNLTLVSAISKDEPIMAKTFTGSVDSDRFIEFMSELIELCRRKFSIRNCVFIMDNARIHHSQSTRILFNERGINILYLSAYSYMLNPIEFAFSKVKNNVRRSLSSGYNDDFSNLIKNAFFELTTDDMKGYYRHIIRNCIKAVSKEDFE